MSTALITPPADQDTAAPAPYTEHRETEDLLCFAACTVGSVARELRQRAQALPDSDRAKPVLLSLAARAASLLDHLNDADTR